MAVVGRIVDGKLSVVVADIEAVVPDIAVVVADIVERMVEFFDSIGTRRQFAQLTDTKLNRIVP